MQKRQKFSMILFWVLAIGWIAVLFFFSGQGGVESADLSGRLTQFLMRRLDFLSVSAETMEFVLRKAAHFGIFVVEGLLLALAMLQTLPKRRWAAIGASAACCGALAVLNELHQTLMPDRSCELRDMIIDFSGALIGIFAAMVLYALAHTFFSRRTKDISAR